MNYNSQRRHRVALAAACLVGAFALVLAACDVAPRADSQAQAEAITYPVHIEIDKKSLKPPIYDDIDDDPFGEAVARAMAPRAKEDLCWQDYCPCDNPETELDSATCRSARDGIEMSDVRWSIGAMARDLKRASQGSNRQMDEIMRDIEAQRSRLRASPATGIGAAPNYRDY